MWWKARPVIDMSGVTEFVPFVTMWAAPVMFLTVAVWGTIRRRPGSSSHRARFTGPKDGPFDSVTTFAVFMANAALGAALLTGLVLLFEWLWWDSTLSESAVFSSEISRVYGISLHEDSSLDETGVGVGIDEEGRNVIFRYDEESGALIFPEEW